VYGSVANQNDIYVYCIAYLYCLLQVHMLKGVTDVKSRILYAGCNAARSGRAGGTVW